MIESKKGVVFFILLFALVLFVSSSLRDLWNPDEPRFAQVSREMIQTGNYWVPHLNGEIYTDKPPLYCWITVAVAKSFFNGEVNAFASRFPSTVSAVAILILIFWMGKRMYGPLGGFLSVLVLATTYRFWWQAAWGQLDMLLTFFIVAALASFWKVYSSFKTYPLWQRGLLWALFYVSLVGGFLTKGPIGILFPCGIIFFFLVWEKQLGFLLRMWIPMGIVLIATLAGIWIWGAYERAGWDYLYQHYVYHNFTRYTDPAGHIRPFYYYFLHFPVDSLPWFLFLPFAIYFYRKNRLILASSHRFLLVWFVLIFLFFSLSDSKRNLYLLPLYPALSLLLGGTFLNWVSQRRWQKIFVASFAFGGILAVTTLLVIFPLADARKSARPLCEQIEQLYPGQKVKVVSYKFFKESFLFYLNGLKIPLNKVDDEEILFQFLKEKPTHLALMQDDEWDAIKEKQSLQSRVDKKVGSDHFYVVTWKHEPVK